MYLIYKHTNMINGKIYIGKTNQEPEVRYGSNGNGYRACPHFYNAIKKYGWENFKHEILLDGLTEEEASEKEIEFISQYDSCNPDIGYNIRRGGDGFNSIDSKKLWANDDYRKRITEKNKAHWANPQYKEKASNLMRIAWKDPDKRKRRSHAAKERWADEEFHKKTRERVLEACKTSVQCVETEEVFDAIVDACKKYNIHHSNIIRSIKTGYRCGGFHWRYTNVS